MILWKQLAGFLGSIIEYSSGVHETSRQLSESILIPFRVAFTTNSLSYFYMGGGGGVLSMENRGFQMSSLLVVGKISNPKRTLSLHNYWWRSLCPNESALHWLRHLRTDTSEAFHEQEILQGFRLCDALGEERKLDARKATGRESVYSEQRRLSSKMFVQLSLLRPALEITAFLPCPFSI